MRGSVAAATCALVLASAARAQGTQPAPPATPPAGQPEGRTALAPDQDFDLLAPRKAPDEATRARDAELMQQLRERGKLVIPVGTRRDQSLMIVTKKNGGMKSRVATQCRFVPLRGAQGWR